MTALDTLGGDKIMYLAKIARPAKFKNLIG